MELEELKNIGNSIGFFKVEELNIDKIKLLPEVRQMCEMQLSGCPLPFSGETFFINGSIWNAGNTGLSGQRD